MTICRITGSVVSSCQRHSYLLFSLVLNHSARNIPRGVACGSDSGALLSFVAPPSHPTSRQERDRELPRVCRLLTIRVKKLISSAEFLLLDI